MRAYDKGARLVLSGPEKMRASRKTSSALKKQKAEGNYKWSLGWVGGGVLKQKPWGV